MRDFVNALDQLNFNVFHTASEAFELLEDLREEGLTVYFVDDDKEGDPFTQVPDFQISDLKGAKFF